MKNNAILRLSGVALFSALAAFGPVSLADTVVTESAGAITEYNPDSLVIHSEVRDAPTRYVLDKQITYVDDAGAPVAIDVLKSGLPITVQYVRDGDRVIARRVVVHRQTAIPAPVVVEEHRTTTTTTTTK